MGISAPGRGHGDRTVGSDCTPVGPGQTGVPTPHPFAPPNPPPLAPGCRPTEIGPRPSEVNPARCSVLGPLRLFLSAFPALLFNSHLSRRSRRPGTPGSDSTTVEPIPYGSPTTNVRNLTDTTLLQEDLPLLTIWHQIKNIEHNLVPVLIEYHYVCSVNYSISVQIVVAVIFTAPFCQ